MNNILAAGASFSPNLIRDLKEMWQYPFMQHAFQAGTLVAIVAGVVGYFVVLRRLSFAAHALSHIGFSGAAGAVLIGLNPLAGLLAFTIGGGTAIALLGKRAINQDVQIGTVLAFILGLGVLFISLYKGYATEAYSLLFGEILGISARNVAVTAIAVLFTLAAVTVLFRKLVFTSIDEDVAEAKGISLAGMNVAFMVLVALAVSVSVQVVGVLLIFALMVTPAAIADRIAKRPAQGVAISVGVSVLATWVSLFVSYYLPYPVSFFITSLTFGGYLVVRVWQWRSKTSS
ncbi:MAG TPA: metal ABC transporter permease [Candidatus Saccharimonadales bacterium]|nr:metal ABC transporter permease [Candidatus Saccharimonadales bacterium]